MAATDELPANARALVIRQDEQVDAATDLARSVELLRAVADGSIREDRVLRLATPVPTVAMSRRESRLPGFETAVRASRAHGFDPVIRPTGGRAVAYDETCLVFDLVTREDESSIGQAALFREVGDALVRALRGLGVDARVGDVPGEYCPGEFSINARDAVKLIGTSQRAVRGARLLSGMLPLGGIHSFVAVLTEVNAALGLDWDPATFGSLAAEVDGLPRRAVEAAIAAEFAGR
ncbi:lipoate--protein ligase family protein [Microbacterium hominis]|uniref:Lipoate--protein ligase family protein n=1 Tax=Microbacterium hominis TaxID=162426 RepID=A0A7D4TPA0_9MICO|nr:lipoate--protein ligase family protein [Microbacterium hominis]QKJ18024.1 lipoate--protein ligase family protein [Microbacterium hominis]